MVNELTTDTCWAIKEIGNIAYIYPFWSCSMRELTTDEVEVVSGGGGGLVL